MLDEKNKILDCPTCGYAKRIKKALNVAWMYGQSDGAHHKAWVIDQMVRALWSDEGDMDGYDKFVADFCDGGDGPNTYEWDKGIAP